MSALNPTNVVENRWHRSIVLSAQRSISCTESEGAGCRDSNYLAAQWSDVCSKVSPILVVVLYFDDVRPVRADAERIDDVAADQVRVSDIDSIVEVFIAVGIDRKRIL